MGSKDNRNHRRNKKGDLFTITTREYRPNKKQRFIRAPVLHQSKQQPKTIHREVDPLENVLGHVLDPSEYDGEKLILVRNRGNGGKVVFTQRSDDSASISTPRWVYDREEEDTIVDMHSHPNGTPFSDTDMWTYLTERAPYRGYAITDDVLYVVDKTNMTPDESEIDRDEFISRWEEAFRRAEEEVENTLPSDYPTGSFTGKNVPPDEMAMYILTNKYFAESYGMIFVVKEKNKVLDHG